MGIIPELDAQAKQELNQNYCPRTTRFTASINDQYLIGYFQNDRIGRKL